MNPTLSRVVLFNEEDSFHRMEHFNSSDVRGPDLTFPIHPLFQTIEGTKDDEYRYPVTACRLASLLLEKALPFFHSILVVGDSVVNCNNGTLKHICPEPKASLTIVEQQMTRAKLNELATGVRIIPSPPDKSNVDALCDPQSLVTFRQLPGPGSVILLNVDRLDDIMEAEDDGHFVAMLWSTIVLATTLVHELVHAAVYSMHTCRCTGIFVGGSQTSENGFDPETFLFGGILNRFGVADDLPCYFIDEEPSSFLGMICCEEYPNFTRMNNLAPGIQARFRGPPLADTYVYWSTPFPWVHDLLQQSFWDNALTGGNNALHPPRTSGVIMAESADPAVKAQQQQIRAIQLMASGEYEVNERGIISLSSAATEPEDDDSERITTSSEGEEEEQQE
ncbi:hypothetical protein CB0940_07005 [Cercospora beticola]|uniref:Uncharacterized protein n=1 Tax=Cercospora beticola TaxID=122368 RepID=A0A2G5H9A9_CERBT|nr:hypothetical protein CB0940_07005 [Cercospora beticola]PIA89117.1 hypothetical protein CB0940_07005 [Cercospora beticola]WPB02926.1 hypothetical protein RHO25_007562 [Cercospora beticola]